MRKRLAPALRVLALAVALTAPGLRAAEAGTLATRPAIREALAYIQRAEPATLDEQVRLCEIPAPPFQEKIRAEYYRAKFIELGLQDVRIDAEGNVLGVRPGRANGPLVVFDAHLDTVFPAEVSTKVTRTGTILKGPGIADNCRGLAVLLTVARALQQSKITTEATIVFVGSVGEEGLGDLRGVKHLFAKELAGRITHFVALDGTGLGAADGAVGSYRYRVTFRAPGGHSYGMFGLANPIHALGRAIDKIARFQVPDSPKTTFNVGRIEGGTSVNSVAHTVSMEIDMRSVSAAELDKVDASFRAAIASALKEENDFWAQHARNPRARLVNARNPVTADIERIGTRPTGKVADDAPILAAVRRADAALGIKSSFSAGSTNSNTPISLGIPAVTLRTGGDGSGNHALDEQFDSKDSHLGTQRAFLALLEIAGVAP
ncbi:MAG: M20/M25/M40 family metallo-hydrolase [Opitutaceae bacterium]|nr:M20/M25/M40 family metallo-hydrolase [Opitutaceae bacterium]